MRPQRVVVGLAILLLAAPALSGYVEIRFSGETDETTPRAFSGWLRYEKPVPTLEYLWDGPNKFASYSAAASDADASYISWAVTIGSKLYEPVASAFSFDEIRVYDGTFGGTHDFVKYLGSHVECAVETDKSSLALTFGDSTATLIDGWAVPEPLPDSGWSSAYMTLRTWETGSVVQFTGEIDSVTVVPLPHAVWTGLAFLGGLALRRRLRRHST